MMNTLIFRVIVAALLTGFMLHRGFYTCKIQHAPGTIVEQPERGRATQIASLLTLLALLSTAIYVIVPDWLSWARLPLPAWVQWLGVGLAFGGFALLQWAQQSLGKNWSDDPKLVAGQALITNGPYRWVRHPIYTAFLLIFGALLLISANWVVGGLWAGAMGLEVASRIGTEEAMLAAQFGEPYRAYVRETGRLLPRMHRE